MKDSVASDEGHCQHRGTTMRSGCLSVAPQRDGAQVLFGFTFGARQFECSFGKILRRTRSAVSRPIGAAVADVQVVPHFFHGALSSAVTGVALKRAFWDPEDVLASVGIAKSSSGFACTDLPCCPECLAKRKITHWLFFFYECECRCFGNKMFSAEAIPWRRKWVWWTKRQRLHAHMFCELFCS